jgi:hypothetical protein
VVGVSVAASTDSSPASLPPPNPMSGGRTSARPSSICTRAIRDCTGNLDSTFFERMVRGSSAAPLHSTIGRSISTVTGRSPIQARFFNRQPEVAQELEHRRGGDSHLCLGETRPRISSNVRSGCLATLVSIRSACFRQRIALIATELGRPNAASRAIPPKVAANRAQADPAQFRNLPAGCGLRRSVGPPRLSGRPRRACPSRSDMAHSHIGLAVRCGEREPTRRKQET